MIRVLTLEDMEFLRTQQEYEYSSITKHSRRLRRICQRRSGGTASINVAPSMRLKRAMYFLVALSLGE